MNPQDIPRDQPKKNRRYPSIFLKKRPARLGYSDRVKWWGGRRWGGELPDRKLLSRLRLAPYRGNMEVRAAINFTSPADKEKATATVIGMNLKEKGACM